MSETVNSGPIQATARIGALDVLRGVAVCGILLMNIPLMGLLEADHFRPAAPFVVNGDWIAYAIQSVGFAGSMRGLFTLLFGAGMMVMLRQDIDDPSASAPQAYFTRCFALMLLGVAQFAIFLWPGEILFCYGLAGLVLFQFRRAKVRLLLTAAAAILITMSIAMGSMTLGKTEMLQKGEAAAALQAAHKPLTEQQKKALEAREAFLKDVHPDKQAIAEELNQRTTFPGVLAWSTRFWADGNLLSPMALVGVAESVAFMLLGVALYRARVLNGSKSLRFYALLAVGGYGAGLSLRAFEFWSQAQAGFEPTPWLMLFRNFMYEAMRLPTTLGLLGLVLLLFNLGALRWVEAGLKAIGRLALTNYLGQSIITSILFYGLVQLNRFGFAQLMGVCALVWLFQAIASLLWLSRWEMGPAEWLLRSLTYGKLQPLGRRQPLSATLQPAE